MENVQRSDLNPIEEASGYERLMQDFSYTQKELAEILGKSRSHLANTLRLLNLPAAPLCRDDCAGLCPVCGIDRNAAECDCDLNPPDPRWDALRALTFED